MKELYEQLGISSQVYDFGAEIEESLKERFEQFDKTAEYNQLKVLMAMQKNKVSAECFQSSSGYGYDDFGRDTLEKVYADTFHTEACLIRSQITCGTHALAIALFGNLRPGDELLAPAGKPYDTLEEVIGIRPSRGSLAEYGVTYRQVDLKEDGTFDYDAIRAAINEKTKLVEIQRSKGYQTRPSYSVKQIGELISFVKSIKPDVICMVDNCRHDRWFTDQKSGWRTCTDRWLYCRNKRMRGKCSNTYDLSWTWHGSRSISWCKSLFLSGIFPCANGDEGRVKGCCVCGKYL